MPLRARLLSDITHTLRSAPATDAAHEAIVILQQLERKFGPLIGRSSVQWIVARSIDASQATFPWLGPFANPGVSTPPYDGLRAVMEGAEREAIVAATSAMLTAYLNQLITLIGVRLTEQFVRAIFPAVADLKENRSKST